MKQNLLVKTSLCTLGLTIAVGLFATSADALTLNSSSASWSNVIGGSNSVGFQRVGSESQVRWGWSTGKGKSGLGFTGVELKTLDVNQKFLLGALRHYNNPIYGASAATAVDLTLKLDLGEPAVTQFFTFTLEIDETVNEEPCTYPGVTTCPDKIFFPKTIALNSFEIAEKEYTLKILGFTNSLNGVPINQLISEEGEAGQRSFFLFGKIVSTEPEEVPEPGILAGLSLLATYFVTCPLAKR